MPPAQPNVCLQTGEHRPTHRLVFTSSSAALNSAGCVQYRRGRKTGLSHSAIEQSSEGEPTGSTSAPVAAEPANLTASPAHSNHPTGGFGLRKIHGSPAGETSSPSEPGLDRSLAGAFARANQGGPTLERRKRVVPYSADLVQAGLINEQQVGGLFEL